MSVLLWGRAFCLQSRFCAEFRPMDKREEPSACMRGKRVRLHSEWIQLQTAK